MTEADFFARLGLGRGFDIDRDDLERRYLERSRLVHPDRFANAEAGQRRAAMEASAALNEGYRVLRDPVSRAEYLCKLHGVDIDSSDPGVGAPTMSQNFLSEMIEQREALERAQDRGADAIEQMRAKVEQDADTLFDEAIAELGAGGARAAARKLVARRYLQRLLDEIDGDSD